MMLVLTRQAGESVVINDWLVVTLTNTSVVQVTVRIDASQPFYTRTSADAEALANAHDNVEFTLRVNESVIIDEEFTVVFVAAFPSGLQTRIRMGFEGPSNTKLRCLDAGGIAVKEFEFSK